MAAEATPEVKNQRIKEFLQILPRATPIRGERSPTVSSIYTPKARFRKIPWP